VARPPGPWGIVAERCTSLLTVSSRVAMRRRRLSVRLTTVTFVWSLGLLVAALTYPAFDGQTVTNADGVTLTTATFVQVNGTWVLIPVALPAVASAAVGLALRQRLRGGLAWADTPAWVLVGVLWALAVISIGTIGAFMIPVAVLLTAGLALVREAGGGSDPGPRRVRAEG
jgi:hypothetical protein